MKLSPSLVPSTKPPDKELEELGFPYNDTLTEIFYRFSNNEPSPYDFYYINDVGQLMEDTVYHVLSFSKHSDNPVQEVMANIVSSGDGEYFPFAIDENGDFICLYITELGEEEIRLYFADLDTSCQIIDSYGNPIILEDFFNGMK